MLLERRQGNLVGIQCGNSDPKSTWGTQWRGYLLMSEYVPKSQHSQRPLQEKGTRSCHFPLLPLSISTAPPVGTTAGQTLLNLLTQALFPTPTHAHSSGTTLPSHVCLGPRMAGPYLPKVSQNPANTASPDAGALRSLGSSDRGSVSHFTSRPEHT